MGYVDQNDEEGRDWDIYLQRCLWRMRQKNYLFITVGSVHAPWQSQKYYLELQTSQILLLTATL